MSGCDIDSSGLIFPEYRITEVGGQVVIVVTLEGDEIDRQSFQTRADAVEWVGRTWPSAFEGDVQR